MLTALCWVLLSNCSSVQHSTPIFPTLENRSSRDFTAEAPQGMIATAHPLASAAGQAMLLQGGNAIDAAVAASFAISVLRPQSSGIGGGGFLLYYQEKTQSTSAFDFRERAPKNATRDMFIDKAGRTKHFNYAGYEIPEASRNGHLSVGVPGLVAGLLRVHREFGSLPLPIVMEPAIKLAAEGFPVNAQLAQAIELRKDVLQHFPASAAIFLPGNKVLKEGSLLRQSDLAQTLRLIADKGSDAFYRGEIADKIVAEMQRGKGILSKSDLQNYNVKIRQPLVADYHGYRIVAMPPPSSAACI
jgi:gamma-glutamyltranspeptidase/glutathione hydrolase